MHAAPGQAAVSMLSGEITAPGQGAKSLLDGTNQAGGAPGRSMQGAGPAGPGGAAVSQLGGEIAAPGQGAKSLLDGTQQAGAPGQSMQAEARGPGQAGQPMKGDAGGPGQPGQSMKGEAGGPGQPGQSMVEAGASGGPGQPGQGKDAAGGASGGPGAGQAKAEGELKAGEPGAKDSAPGGASGGPAAAKAGGAKDEDELVDPNADRPDFGSGHDADADAVDPAFASVAARAGAGNAKGGATGEKANRKPVDPAYVTVGVMGLAVLSLAGLIWLGRGLLVEMYPGIAGFYQTLGVEAPRPGEGLKIAESSKRVQRIAGVETFVVRGFISNISDVPKTVPNLRLELYSEKKEVIQDTTLPPTTGILDPGASIEFEIRLELPQLKLAKGGYGLVWQE